MEELLETLEYTVPELAELWAVNIKVVIRMAATEKIPVQCLLRDVTLVAVKKDRKKEEHENKKGILEKGFPSFEEFIKNIETEAHQIPQWTVKLEQFHLKQMMFDGFADFSQFPNKNGDTIIMKTGGQPAKALPKDCFILGKYALQIEEKYNLKEKGKNSKAGKSDGKQTANQGLTLPAGHEYESSLVEILNLITPELYPDGLKGQEKSAITKSVNTLKEQLPEAFELCCSLVMEAMPCADREEHLKYTRDDVVQQAKERGINRPMALQIHKGLPAVMKK